MTRDEILGLSKMSDGEAQNVLIANGIIHMTDIRYDYGVVRRAESLADLADRLWREAVESHSLHLVLAVREVFNNIYNPQIKRSAESIDRWLAYEASNINKIQAALLAKEGV